MKIDFICTAGPFGDCTSNYDVIPSGPITLRQFVQYIISERKDEWGHIQLGRFGDKIIEYRRGDITASDEFESVADMEIASITANGGWYCMCYFVKLK